MEGVCELLEQTKEDVLDFFIINTEKVLGCILEASEVFVGNSYMKSYLYYFEKEYLVLYDYLFVRMATFIQKGTLTEQIQFLFEKDKENW